MRTPSTEPIASVKNDPPSVSSSRAAGPRRLPGLNWELPTLSWNPLSVPASTAVKIARSTLNSLPLLIENRSITKPKTSTAK